MASRLLSARDQSARGCSLPALWMDGWMVTYVSYGTLICYLVYVQFGNVLYHISAVVHETQMKPQSWCPWVGPLSIFLAPLAPQPLSLSNFVARLRHCMRCLSPATRPNPLAAVQAVRYARMVRMPPGKLVFRKSHSPPPYATWGPLRQLPGAVILRYKDAEGKMHDISVAELTTGKKVIESPPTCCAACATASSSSSSSFEAIAA